MISVDAVLAEVGGWGRYQQLLYYTLCLPTFVAGYTVMSLSWTCYNMDFRCLVDGCETATSATYSTPFLNFTIPRHHDPTTGALAWNTCDTFARANVTSDECREVDFNQTVRKTCSQWVYDRSVMNSTIISEFDLTCSRGWLPQLANSLYMGGMLTGSLLLGYISDRFGRKVAMLLSFLVVGLSSVVQAFAPSFAVFAALRFIAGIGGMGIFMCCFVLSVESVGNEERTFCAFVIHCFFGAGAGSVGLLALLLTDWRWLQLTLAVPPLLLLSYWWLVPESPRWLAAQGKIEQLEENLRRAAKCNGTRFPEHLFVKKSNGVTAAYGTNGLVAHTGPETKPEQLPELSVRDLFSSSTLRRRTAIILYQWFITAMIYYGLGLNATSLGSSVHVNFILMQLVEIPACYFCVFTVDAWGRKLTLSLGFLFCAVGCFASGLAAGTGIQWLTVSLAVLGKFGGGVTFDMVFIYGAELFPTDLRNSGIGLSSAAGRVGSLLAPFIAGLSANNSQLLPMSIFGALSLLACLLTLLLPETHGQKLPDTIDETERFGRDQSLCFIPCLIERRRRRTIDVSHKQAASQQDKFEMYAVGNETKRDELTHS